VQAGGSAQAAVPPACTVWRTVAGRMFVFAQTPGDHAHSFKP